MPIRYPGTSMQELNLDWVLAKVKENTEQTEHTADELNAVSEEVTTLSGQLTTTSGQVTSLSGQVTSIGNELEDTQESIADTQAVFTDPGGVIYSLHTLPEGTYFWLNDHIAVTTVDVPSATAMIEHTNYEFAVIGDEITDLKSGITNIGTNLFNKSTALANKYIKADGTIDTKSNVTASDFIRAESSTLHYVSRGLGSSSYITVAEYDTDKTFISGVTKSTTAAFTFTTTATTKYIRLNIASAQVENFIVALGTTTGYSAYKTIGSGNASKLKLLSASPIYYNNSHLKSKTDILLNTIDNNINLGQSVDVGNGTFLFYNSKTGSLYASNTFETTEDIYFVAPLKVYEYRNNNTFINLTKIRCPIEYDTINKTVVITVDTSTYLFYNGKYYAFSSGQSATLTSSTDHFIVYFSFSDEAFHITSSYSSIKNDCVIIMEAYRSLFNAICEVKIINSKNENSGVSFYTFGDSLTWYNGQQFNRGIHEGETCIGYQTYLGYYCNMVLENNLGQSGKTTPQICSTLEAYDFSIKPDAFVFVMGGDNDDRLGVSLGTLQPVGGTFDATTVIGALQHAIETVQTAFPKLRIILMTEPQGWTYENGALDMVNPLIADAYRKVAETYCLPLIDLWAESGINYLNRDTYYADPASAINTDYMYHPNNDGWKRISKLICNRVMGL